MKEYVLNYTHSTLFHIDPSLDMQMYALNPKLTFSANVSPPAATAPPQPLPGSVTESTARFCLPVCQF